MTDARVWRIKIPNPKSVRQLRENLLRAAHGRFGSLVRDVVVAEVYERAQRTAAANTSPAGRPWAPRAIPHRTGFIGPSLPPALPTGPILGSLAARLIRSPEEQSSKTVHAGWVEVASTQATRSGKSILAAVQQRGASRAPTLKGTKERVSFDKRVGEARASYESALERGDVVRHPWRLPSRPILPVMRGDVGGIPKVWLVDIFRKIEDMRQQIGDERFFA